jgi:prepilin-type N-terminal cleavage/methylation domain-containing protein
MKRRGMTLVELAVVVVIIGIITTGLLTVWMSMSGIQSFTTTMPPVQETAQRMTMDVAAAFRKATLATSADTTCTLNAAVESASSTAVTIYSGSNGSITKTTYANSSGNITKATNGGAAAILYAGASLAFTYYQSSSSSYHLASTSGLSSYTPTSSTTKNLVAVQIVGTYTSGGFTATYTTMVRLRNSPLRTSAND